MGTNNSLMCIEGQGLTVSISRRGLLSCRAAPCVSSPRSQAAEEQEQGRHCCHHSAEEEAAWALHAEIPCAICSISLSFCATILLLSFSASAIHLNRSSSIG